MSSELSSEPSPETAAESSPQPATEQSPEPAATESPEPPEHGPTSRSKRWWRRAALLIAVLAVLTLVLHVAGGWYFAGQIHSDALAVDPATIGRDLQVVNAADGTVTLHDPSGDDRVLHSNLVYGLQWDKGYGQMSGAPSGTRTDVTRHLTVLTGTPPVAGVRAGLARDAFPDDPAVALGRPVQDVTYPAPGGATPAWYVPGQGTTWAILVHGWTSSRTEMLRLMRTTVARGLPSLDIAYRNDVGAPADPTHRYQFGRTEWRDLDAAVSWARAHGARTFVLVGASMGGAVIASFLEHSAQQAVVSGLVLDSPMLSFQRAVELGASRRDLPVVGLPVPPTLTWTAERFAAVRWDVDWSATDYLHDTSWDDVPTLVFHGTEDTRVPISGSRELAADHPDHVALVVVPGAAHVEAWNAGPDRYDRAVAALIGRIAS